ILAGGDAVRVVEDRLGVLFLDEVLVLVPVLDVPQFALPLVREGYAIDLSLRLWESATRPVDPHPAHRRLADPAIAEPPEEAIWALRVAWPLRLAVRPPRLHRPVALAADRTSPAAMVAVPHRRTRRLDRDRQAGLALLAPKMRAVRADRL